MRPLSLAVLAGPAVMLGLRALVRPVQLVLMALLVHAMVAWVAPAALVALAQTAVLVEQAAVEPRAAVAVAGLAWLPRVALAVSAASAALGSMQAASPMARQVVMPGTVAKVERAALRA
jgi:hypothetical protein